MSVFQKIICGEFPGRFVWEDEICVAFATIEPVTPGHVLVVPRQAIDKYSDVAPEDFAHLAKVAQIIGRAQEKAFQVPRSILTILGFEVPHTHIHVIPATSEADGNLARAQAASAEELDAAMEKLRSTLQGLGYGANVPADMHHLRSTALQ